MGTIPTKKAEQLAFFESHWPVWQTAPTTIGLTAAQVTSFKTLVVNARTAFDAAQAARNAAKAATGTQDLNLELAFNACTDLVRVIKSYAEQQTNPDAVYNLAQIPPPANPQPAPPPGLPTNVTVNLESNGAVTLHWKAVNAAANAGTFFSIKRKLPGESVFTLAGNSGVKFFTDSTITQGTTGATYIIQGHRGDINGDATEQISVQFGVGGGGGFVVSGATAMKMAA